MPKKQDDLPAMEGPGVAVPKIKAIEAASDKYVEVRDERMALTEKEIQARDKLVALMKEHGIKEYIYQDHKVVVVPGVDKVKVKNMYSETDTEGED